jgi:2-amino-4-hydroxy-6-hydroxymethyldihydropteridine diphosphokinase
MATALVGLGSNLGDRAAALEKAIELLKLEPQIRVEAVSRFRQSNPAGGPEGQREFLNAAARLETSLSPEELLARLLAIEDQIGRVREEAWGPRVIDLDLLLYDRVEMKTPALELPHPRMCYRRFVLEPAAEIAAEMVWPVNGWTVAKLLRSLNSTARYVAFGCVGEDFDRIIGSISQATRCRIIHEATHSDAIAEVVGKDVDSPPANWLEEVLSHKCQRNAESLAISQWPQDGRWTLSNYWAEWEFEAAKDLLKQSGVLRNNPLFARLQDSRSLVQQPRLVIVLDSGDAALTSVYKRVDQFRRQADSPPSLWLSMADPVRVEREVLAAMQAME